MKQWWQGRSLRERWILGIAGGLVLILIVYQQGWQRLQNLDQQARRAIDQQQQILIWAQQQGNRLDQVVASNGAPSQPTATFSQTANQSATDFGISLTRLQQQQDHYNVWIAPVAFDPLLSWLAQMEQQHGYRVETINIQADKESGIVQVSRLRFGR
ncbi:type II secretion system protein GspM [Celerinatantimonas sp. YJH-8]|uniref:type II secretion system protein GspM n=1 Tax=Celerinatantimonas sp. YJH-8 TaxID=3228714 RepID=UPI0038CB1E34